MIKIMLNLPNLLAIVPVKTEKTPLRAALEDVVVMFMFTLIPLLIVIGFPPSLETIYVPLLSSGLIGLTTYARARGVALTGSKE